MAIQFVCDKCGKLLQTEDFQAGTALQCPGCKATVMVPPPGQPAFVEFACLACGTTFRVPAHMAGKRTHCPECNAALEVPSALNTLTTSPPPTPPSPPPAVVPPVAPPQINTEPPPVPPFSPPRTVSRPAEHTDYVPGETQDNTTGMILLIICGVLLLLTMIGLVYYFTRPRTASADTILVAVNYKRDKDELDITNQTVSAWEDVLLEIHVGDVIYKCSPPSPWPARRTVTVSLRSFSASGQPPLDPFRIRPDKLVVWATLPEGIRTSRTVPWMRQSQGGTPTDKGPASTGNPSEKTDAR